MVERALGQIQTSLVWTLYYLPNNMILLVNMDKFDPNLVLVHINKLKPYVPYDGNSRGLGSKFQGGKRESTTLET